MLASSFFFFNDFALSLSLFLSLCWRKRYMTPTILSFLFVQELIKCKFSLFVFINLITQMNESSSKCRSIRLTDFSCCCYFQCEREREKNKDNMCNSNRIIAIASIVHSMRYEELIFSALNLNNTFLQHKIVVDAHFLFFCTWWKRDLSSRREQKTSMHSNYYSLSTAIHVDQSKIELNEFSLFYLFSIMTDPDKWD